ncbi:hypothetical protein OKA04_20855 [Luteolibacter flavescens]|uniref:Restriction endonuclease n=1 Tax=Luteolibacter flavescens TaxID=1859460 RepID=A0ABT3FUD7_9BACT|nr:hypothetical protein [Luteolibacter flavescens]MCW1887201.1 hypothetical protein [Luteolibacter flavescens]
MAKLTTTTCPHCGAEMDAFHFTRWDRLSPGDPSGLEICPACDKPLNPERYGWQEALGSGVLRRETVSWLAVVAATATTIAIVGFAARCLHTGDSTAGLVALGLLAGLALCLIWHRMQQPAKPPALVELELFPHATTATAPAPPPEWDMDPPGEGVPAIVPQPRERHQPPVAASTAPPLGKALPLEEITRRIALAWLEPRGDHPIRRQVVLVSEKITRWPRMSAEDADRKFGTPVAVGSDGTRAYGSVRADGRASLSLLGKDGAERVLRLYVKWRKPQLP